MAMLPTDFSTNGSESPDGMGDDAPECILWGEIFRIVLCSLVMVFGLPGNSLILGVYWDKLRKTSTHILIMGLAWADLFTCLFLTHEVVSSCLIATSAEWGTALLILKSLMMVTVSLSIGITAIIALDRYDCVCCSHRRRVTPHLAKVAILCSLIFSALIQIIYVLHVVIDPLGIQMKLTTLAAQFIMFVVSVMLILVCYLKVFSAVRRHVKVGVHTWPHHAQSSDHTQSNPVQNISEWQETVTATLNSLRKLTPPAKLKAIALNPALQQGATSVESTTFLAPKIATRPTNLKAPTRLQHTETSKDTERNIQTGHSDTAPNRQRSTGTRHTIHKVHTMQNRTTLMLFLTSLIFVLSWLPYWTFVGLSIANILGQPASQTVTYTFDKMVNFLHVNHAINPLLYGLANRRFRKDCKDFLKKSFRH